MLYTHLELTFHFFEIPDMGEIRVDQSVERGFSA